MGNKLDSMCGISDEELTERFDAAMPEEMPNAETIASIEELENGGGTLFKNSTEDLFAELMMN